MIRCVEDCMEMWSAVCENILLPLSGLIIGGKVKKELENLRKFQWLSREEIERYQNNKFRNLINKVYDSVPFYLEYFKENGLTCNDFRVLSDLEKLPILSKDTLNSRKADLRSSSHVGNTHVMKSSGSTGKQSEVVVDDNVNCQVYASQLLFWDWGGFKVGTPHLQTGMSLDRSGLKGLKDYFFRCSYVSAFGLSDQDLMLIVKTIRRKKIKYLFGYASSIYVIAKFCIENRINIKMNKIFTWGDCLYPNYRKVIEDSFCTLVHDCYGLGEGLQVASQCEQVGNMHINEANIIVEIVDEGGMRRCGIGEVGRVLITRIEPGPMPLIRYDTGDLAAVVPNDCKCGRNLKTMSRVFGRDTDIIRSPLGDKLIVHFFTQIFEMIPEIKQFQIRQEKYEKLSIYYVPGNNFHNQILRKINDEIISNCKYKFEIEFISTNEIPLLASNKRRFVISSIPFS